MPTSARIKLFDVPAEQSLIVMRYMNWRGMTSVRTIRAVYVWFGSTEFHQKPGPMLNAIDLESGHTRDFAMVDILEVLSSAVDLSPILIQKAEPGTPNDSTQGG